MTEKIRLGVLKRELPVVAPGEVIYLTKHEWQCGWYWAFGWLGNRNCHCHFHFEALPYPKDERGEVLYKASKIFAETNITDREWWIIRDLLVQAYALKKAAEVYRYGGHQTTCEGVTNLIQSPDMVRTLNEDLKKVLDRLWDYVCQAVKEK